MNRPLSLNERAAIECRRERDAREAVQRPNPRTGSPSPVAIDWPEPQALPSGLLRVATLDLDCLPRTLAPWVRDIADRMQCHEKLAGLSTETRLFGRPHNTHLAFRR